MCAIIQDQFDQKDEATTTGNNTSTGWGATYAVGSFTVGYQETRNSMLMIKTEFAIKATFP